MENNQDRIYLPGLNALRFFAAFLVIMAHVEMLKDQLGLPNNVELVDRFNPGGLGVYFFFVLSGFLITYLLIIEKQKTNTVNIKAFYIRRILRIWPLYYFIVLLAFFVFPEVEFFHVTWLEQFFDSNFIPNLILFLLMLPNLALAFFPAVPHAGQLWSIGVEEQFYIIWPALFRKTKNLSRLLLIILIGVLSLKIITVVFWKFSSIGHSEMFVGIKNFLVMSKFECMAIGAFGAHWVIKKARILNLMYNQYLLGLGVMLLPFINYFCPEVLMDGVHIPYSLIFLIIILNTATNPKSFINLENKIFNFLGKISYGLYMYHMFIVVVMIRVVNYFYEETGVVQNIAIYSLSVVSTIIVSWLSYEFFEKPFLKLKQKFTVVKSGKI